MNLLPKLRTILYFCVQDTWEFQGKCITLPFLDIIKWEVVSHYTILFYVHNTGGKANTLTDQWNVN